MDIINLFLWIKYFALYRLGEKLNQPVYNFLVGLELQDK